MTDKQLSDIVDWFARHRDDYDPQSPNNPPKIWAEYFEKLLKIAVDSRQSRPATPQEWQPIETGPEATWVLVMVPNYGMNIATMTRDPNILGPNGAFWFIRGEQDRCRPTHWMSLPAAPHGADTQGQGKA